jgi:tyrosine decarboxylase/aspartate 1-decarboxylase
VQESGWSLRQVRKALAQARSEDWSFDDGEIVGSMCTAPHEVAAAAHAQFLDTNLGDPGHFPGTARLEKEVLADLLQLLRAPPGAAGRFLTGGTEGNLLAAYLAREVSGRREILLPESGHFSFEKAARLLDMELTYVRTAPSGHADAAAMERAIGRKTALMVGIAGTTELGLVDPIQELSEIAARARLAFHVDAAFGGYMLPFMEPSGRTPKPFDFALPGVTSISLDPHKMGLSTIPGGTLFLREGALWERIAVVSPYVSTNTQSTLMGTRPGASVAAAWAVHRHLGRAGFASVVETCLDNAAYLAAQLQNRGAELVANPELTVVAVRSDDPERLAAKLQKEGFRVNTMPRLSAIRIVVNPHVTRQTIEKLLAAYAKVAA